MQAKLGNDTVDVWQITREPPTEDWVQEAFRRHQLFWDDEMGVRPPLVSFFMKKDSVEKIKQATRGKIPRHFLMIDGSASNVAIMGVNPRGAVGDYLYKHDGLYQFCSEKTFQKIFRLL